jgi:hypothetical protein
MMPAAADDGGRREGNHRMDRSMKDGRGYFILTAESV